MEIALKIAEVAWKIKVLVDNVRANNKRCRRLNDRISVLVPLIQQLHGKKALTNKYTAALERLLVCVERCYAFIKKFTESNWFVRVYDQACHRDTFDELNQTLYSCATDLNLALAVQNHFKGEQDEIDRHDDREFLSKNFDKIIRLQSEYSQQHQVQLGNIERMFQSLVDNNKQNLEALMDGYKRQQMHEEEKLFIHVQYSQVILEQLIASASSGNVYKGRWSNSKVVVKELKISAMKGHEQEEFVKAVAILTRIRHENIVQHLGACIEEPDRYLVLSELMPLGSLNAILRDKALEFTWTDRWSIAKQITNAILYLHTYCSPPIIHKDIKSSNILLDYYGSDRRRYRAKINDFGLDQIHGSVGTLAWSAPETLRTMNRRVFNTVSDVYSLGVVMWELATGQVPYANQLPGEIIRQICEGQRLPISYEHIPRMFANILYQTWNEDVEERLSCEQVYARLVIGSKRVDSNADLWPDTVKSSTIHLDPPNVLDHLLTLKYQSDQPIEHRNIQAITEAANELYHLTKSNPKPIPATYFEHLISIGESFLETKTDVNSYINATCRLIDLFAQKPSMNAIIVEQGGVVFLLHVIQTFADTDQTIVKRAGDALNKLNSDIQNDSSKSSQVPTQTKAETKKQNRSSLVATNTDDSDPTIVLRQVTKQVQLEGRADQRVLTMIEDLLENTQDEVDEKVSHKKKSKKKSSEDKWRIGHLFGKKSSAQKK
ncbi:unnamed protein product [Rotaria sp. Silwood1]|nr:unnamed protein product [Rotaria sp. Silwood1]CAF1303279.1 unnamed protein product [Rotaria sp. Silwood1]CAF3524079.1 unnamed protein product [Rotaria sp. Silwood1]CAF4602699.1 unnamed protein product [Rotaria sp. Silwood1]